MTPENNNLGAISATANTFPKLLMSSASRFQHCPRENAQGVLSNQLRALGSHPDIVIIIELAMGLTERPLPLSPL